MSQPPDPAVPPAPAYPGEPAYPGAAAPSYPSADPTAAAPQYPGVPPQHPAPPAAPAYPAAPAPQPPYPGAAALASAPAYPGPRPEPLAAPPAHPATHSGRPDTDVPWAGPEPAAPPYPGGGIGGHPDAAPAYPGPEPTASAHPAAGPAHPTAAPPYPGADTGGNPGSAPAYPGPESVPPAYPGAPPAHQSAPPPYPGATTSAPTAPPHHPSATTAPPTYPGATPTPPGMAPGHPVAPPAHQSVPPSYPGAASSTPTAPPHHPSASNTPPTYPGASTAPPPPSGPLPHAEAPPAPGPEPAPDDLDYRHAGARVLVAEHQRGADATAIGRLAVQVPGAVVSLAVVSSIAIGMLGSVLGWIVTLAWLASGALVFHRPAELAFARRVLKLRLPTAEERARLEPVWREVTARAGIEARTYELMVENSDELNAVAVAGHVVGVTTYALNRIPSSNLAAVLAHELGHHTGGHAWAGLLGYWYSLPGRVAWAVMRGLARIAIAVARVFSLAATGFVYLFLGIVVVAGFVGAWYITIPLVAAPYLLAYAGRRGELRADQQAAELGFGRRLAEVIHHFRTEEEAAKAAATAQGQKLQEPGTLARLLSTHPDHDTRLSALEPYLRLTR
ncbi:M48 family metalloprotease [Streptomyces sp. NPDC020801]|uniref:M48 family metalloprotease n=1 Tax=unclassified Streptomyces TaxID=2593676 RepID=UPI0037A71EBA